MVDFGIFQYEDGWGVRKLAADAKTCSLSDYVRIGNGSLWFIQMLWAFSVLLVIFRKIDKDRLWSICGRANTAVLVLFVLIIWGAANIGNVPYITVYRFGIYGIGYFIGYFVLSHGEVTERAEKFRLPLGAAAIILGTAFVIVYWGAPYAEHTVLDTPLCNFYALVCGFGDPGIYEKARQYRKRIYAVYEQNGLPTLFVSLCARFRCVRLPYLYGVNIPPFFKYVLHSDCCVFGRNTAL